MNQDVIEYNRQLDSTSGAICKELAEIINRALPKAQNKVWHAHPVWFLDGNPIVGYSQQKAGIRLMFWSGADFDEPRLSPSKSGKFKDASVFYTDISEIDETDVDRWLQKSKDIQWDYKNIIKHKGKLVRLK